MLFKTFLFLLSGLSFAFREKDTHIVALTHFFEILLKTEEVAMDLVITSNDDQEQEDSQDSSRAGTGE